MIFFTLIINFDNSLIQFNQLRKNMSRKELLHYCVQALHALK
jgi:hypothetical protein